MYLVKYVCFVNYVQMCLTSPIQKKKKKEKKENIINIMSTFLPNTTTVFSERIFKTLLDKFRLACGFTFFRNNANRNISTPIGDVLHHC